MFERILENLATAGPLASVLAAAVWVLWKKLGKKEKQIARLNRTQRKFFAEIAGMEWEEEEEEDDDV